jgi:hypothetical protein
MTHAQLVQTATDLLFGSPSSEKWLPQYDLALAGDTDQLLIELVQGLHSELQNAQHRLAA